MLEIRDAIAETVEPVDPREYERIGRSNRNQYWHRFSREQFGRMDAQADLGVVGGGWGGG